MTSELRAQLQSTLGSGYTLERELSGGMSRVFVAEDMALRRRIVVKVLPPELAADLSIARFQREIALVARLQHPHIVPLLSAGETNGLPYFTMPYVDGESLRARLASGGELAVAEAVRLLREIASALAYAHEQHVVHRDIKPENVLLTRGIALVTDFGVGKAIVSATMEGHDGHESLTSIGVALGTPAYMAPEQAMADPATDHRADLYALGVVAYEMLAGQPPFVGRNTQALIAAHITEAPVSIAVRRPALPASLAAVVMRCLEKRPADRPQTAREIIQALDAIATPTATPASSPPRPSSNTGSRLAMRGALAALAVLVVASGLWVAIKRRTTPSAVISKRVLIAPFENLTGDPRFDGIGRIIADRLAQGIAQVGSIDVVPSNTVLITLRDTTGGQADRVRRLAIATRAGLLATGTVILRGDSLVLQAQLTSVQTGNIAVALQPIAGVASDPIAVVDALGDRMLGALASRQMTMIAVGLQAPKYAAYQEFEAGFDRFAFHGDLTGALPHFERAIAIDSTYARSYTMLARVHINRREFGTADSILHLMRKIPGGLNVVDQLQMEYQQADLEGDLPRQLSLQQQIAARDSSTVALFLIGEAAVSLLQPRLAIPALERSDSGYTLVGGPSARGHVSNLAEAYHELGEHDRELRALDRRRLYFSGALFSARTLRTYAGLKRRDAALALADTMLRAGGDSTGAALSAVTTAAMEFRAHGDAMTASRLLTMARGWYTAHPAVRPPTSRTMSEGIAMLMTGAADSAVSRFSVLTRDSTAIDAAGYLGLAQAARGDRARARAIADSLGALKRPWLFGANTFWRAAILGALGDRDAAVQLLQQANREGQGMESWHYTARLDALHGFPAFEALVRPRG